MIVLHLMEVATPFSKTIIKIGRKKIFKGKTISKGSNKDFRDLLTLDPRHLFEISRGHRVQKSSLVFYEDIKPIKSNVVLICKVLVLSSLTFTQSILCFKSI